MTPSQSLSGLLDTGFVGRISQTPFFTDEPKLQIYTARSGEAALEDRESARPIGQGIAVDPETAKLKAAAELVERISLRRPETGSFRRGKFGDFDRQLDPGELFCYSEDQVPDREDALRRIRAEEIEWIEVNDCLGLGTLWAPVELFYFAPSVPQSFRIRRETNSTGAALGEIGTGRAFQSALLEAVERDSVMGFWLLGGAVRRIVGLPSCVGELVDLLARYRLECRLFDITSDLGVPTALSLTIDRTGLGPAVAVGSAASLTLKQALRKALLESISFRRSARIRMAVDPIPQVREPSDIVSPETRAAYWFPLDRLPSLLTRFEPAQNTSFVEPNQIDPTTEAILEALSARRMRVLASDITPPAVRAQGFEVQRVLVPELHPLYLREASKALFSAHYGAIPRDPDLLAHPFA